MNKEIPMLYSTPMVQAILQDRKTMTRRLAAVPNHDHYGTDIMDWGLSERPRIKDGKWMYSVQSDVDSHNTFELKAKYGKRGDLLWVRESWQMKGWDFEEGMMTIKYATGETHTCLAHDPDEDSSWLMDKVDFLEARGYIKPDTTNEEMFVFTDKRQPFCPSIHMPKEAARIWLKVTDVRVERLQDITEDDAIAEGVEKINDGAFPYKHYGGSTASCADAKTSFRTLWLEINGDESWDMNPFVWVVSFEVLSTTGKPSTITEKVKG